MHHPIFRYRSYVVLVPESESISSVNLRYGETDTNPSRSFLNSIFGSGSMFTVYSHIRKIIISVGEALKLNICTTI